MTPLEALDALDLWCVARWDDKQEWRATVRAALTPRVVTTAAELNALPMGAVIRPQRPGEPGPVLLKLRPEGGVDRWSMAGDGESWSPAMVADLVRAIGPFLVLWTPPQQEPGTP